MIGLELSLQCSEQHHAELAQTLKDLSQAQIAGGSCVECDVYESLRRSSGFIWLQWWRSERDLQDHLASVEFRTLLGAVKVLGSLVSTRVVGLQDSSPSDRSPGSVGSVTRNMKNSPWSVGETQSIGRE
jgi:quinol monooxygenase YgiN